MHTYKWKQIFNATLFSIKNSINWLDLVSALYAQQNMYLCGAGAAYLNMILENGKLNNEKRISTQMMIE